MKQGLVLRADLCRRRNRRQRFDALTLNRHQQPQAVVLHRLMPNRHGPAPPEGLDLSRKARFTPLLAFPVHFRSPDPDEDGFRYYTLRLMSIQLHYVRFFVTQ